MLGKPLYAPHVLGAVLWAGDMSFALLAPRPALARLEPPAARLALHEGARRRFFLIVWHAMPALPLRRARRATGPGSAGNAHRVRRLVLVNFALGLLTVEVAAWGRFGG